MINNYFEDFKEKITNIRFTDPRTILFRQTDNFKTKWDLVIMLLSLFNSFTVPVEMAFSPPFMQQPMIVSANFVIDFVFFLDILICFRTVYLNQRGEMVTDGKAIATNYLKSTFIIDFLATVPFDTILSMNSTYLQYVKESERKGERQWIQILGILKLGRVLRLNKII